MWRTICFDTKNTKKHEDHQGAPEARANPESSGF
jgi:hypothetical protein